MEDFDLAGYAAGSLFADPPDGKFHDLMACTGENGGPYNFGQFAMGYMEANRRLKATLEHDAGMIDVLVYPIVFNYRQAVELALKHLVLFLSPLYGTGEAPEMNHGLVNNWMKLRPLIESHRDSLNLNYASLNKKQLDGVERIIKDLHKFDPTSMKFRYPVDRQHVAFISGFNRIDVAEVVDLMSHVENWFELLIEGIPETLLESK